MAIIDFDDEFWDDPWIQTLPSMGKYLFAYLWTNKHRNPSGIYMITLNTICFETKLDPDQVRGLLDQLNPKVKYDHEHSICWVVKHTRRQFLRGNSIAPRQRIGIRRHALKFKWHPFFLAFARAYPEIFTSDEIEDAINSQLNFDYGPSLSRRQVIWVRDDGKCQYCGKEIVHDDDLEIDHVIPISKNGSDRYDNLALSCRPCNQKKCDALPEEIGFAAPKTFYFDVSKAIERLTCSEPLRIGFAKIFGEETLSKGLKGFERVSNPWGKGGGGDSILKEIKPS